MKLLYGLQTAADLHKKLLREADRLEAEVTSDHFFNFVVTALHLQEWIRKDASLKQHAPRLAADPDFGVFRDIANASKHFVPSKPSVESVDSLCGYGAGRYGRGGYGVGEETITIVTDAGETLDALAFRDRVLSLFGTVFADAAV